MVDVVVYWNGRMLRARLLVWWLAVARALPVGDQTASDWAWGWWESPPYLARTEAEPPLIVLEDAPRASPRPHAPPADLHKAVTEELQRNAKEALERIDYWSAPRPQPRPAPSPSPIPGDEWAAVWLPGEGKWAETQTHWAGRRSVGDAPRVPLDLTFMEAVDDWTPRMKREYLRELKREPD